LHKYLYKYLCAQMPPRDHRGPPAILPSRPCPRYLGFVMLTSRAWFSSFRSCEPELGIWKAVRVGDERPREVGKYLWHVRADKYLPTSTCRQVLVGKYLYSRKYLHKYVYKYLCAQMPPRDHRGPPAICQAARQAAIQPSSQPVSQPASQLAKQSASQPACQPACQPSNQTAVTPRCINQRMALAGACGEPEFRSTCFSNGIPYILLVQRGRFLRSRRMALAGVAVSLGSEMLVLQWNSLHFTCPKGWLPASQPARQPGRQPAIQPASQPASQPACQPACQPSRT
jgi:hypothetical protein